MMTMKKLIIILFFAACIFDSWGCPLTNQSSSETVKDYIITKIDTLKNDVFVIYAKSGNDEFKIVSSLDSDDAASETIKVGSQYKLILESLYLEAVNKASDAGWVGYEEHVRGMGIKGNTIPVDSYYGSKRDVYKSPNLNGLYYNPNVTLKPVDPASEINFIKNSSITRKGDATIYCGEEWFKSSNSNTVSGKFQLKEIFWFHKGKDYYYTDFMVEKDGVNYLVIDTIQSHYPYYSELLSKGDNIDINMEISEIWPLNDKLMHCGIFPANKESFTMRDVLFVEEKYGNKIYLVQSIDF